MPLPQANNSSEPRYAEVALPLPLRRTFTYELPEGFRRAVKPGARLLVPFGKRSITGYAVALFSELDEESELDESAIKPAAELLDETPLITPEILRLTQWTADYYAASWGEVLKASLPAGINAAYEQVVSITETGRNDLLRITNAKPLKAQILHRIAEQGEATQRELEKEFGAARVKRAVGDLANTGAITVHQRSVTNKVKPRLRKAVRLLSASNTGEKPLSSAQQSVIGTLASCGGEMIFTELIAKCGGSSAVNTLAKHGLVEVFVQEVRRDPLINEGASDAPGLVLNLEQLFVLSEIERSLGPGAFKAFLLHGVTGSGKTEIYIRAMQTALKSGKSALMLVPEIALTPIFSRRLRAVFGDEVAILHSNLSPGERFDEWRRIHGGRARIVIGTRSAVFAPLENLGLIIVDEEHDGSYRQHESPFYHARDVAVMRARMAAAVAVLGSATPALESFYNAQHGKYHYLQLRNRIANRPLANAELIDMRDVFRLRGKDVPLSPRLIEAIRETHAKGEQSIILLNRRGFSRFVLCRSCGESLRCKNCDITLTYHKIDGRITCHYCGYSVITPRECPFCESEYLYFIGEGTEQLEEILAGTFPDLRIARIDRDTMARRGQLAKALIGFSRGETDMLVGTQMLAKGHDFQNVTLVGVISVDTGLGLPDFRSSERTFQLLTQVAGRAGRGRLPGRVLIQTYYPEHYALRYACRQDYEGFFHEEIKYRQRLSYPPFVVLASLLIKHKDREYAFRNAEMLKESLDRANRENACRVLGVSPAWLSRLKGEYRFQILLKSTSRKRLRETLDIALTEAETRGCDLRSVFTEIDPMNLM